MKLDFTTTAMCRPEILERTYVSFVSHLKGLNFDEATLYINVDPLPKGNSQDDVIKIASRFFGRVVSRIPAEANFSKAVKWCFSKPESEFFFSFGR